jgi:hypothetical protein
MPYFIIFWGINLLNFVDPEVKIKVITLKIEIFDFRD